MGIIEIIISLLPIILIVVGGYIAYLYFTDGAGDIMDFINGPIADIFKGKGPIGGWFKNAGENIGNWTTGAVKDIRNWKTGAVKDTEKAFDTAGKALDTAGKETKKALETAGKEVGGGLETGAKETGKLFTQTIPGLFG